jgi:hypothetical protein
MDNRAHALYGGRLAERTETHDITFIFWPICGLLCRLHVGVEDLLRERSRIGIALVMQLRLWIPACDR